MTAWSVQVESADPERTAVAVATLATLPLSFRRFSAGASDARADAVAARPDVVVVAGSEGWVERAREAASAGARGVVVTDPLPVAARVPLVALADDVSGCAIVLAESWASSPALLTAAERLSAPIARTRVVDARSIEPRRGRDLRAVLFAQLRAVQRLGVEVSSLEVVAETASSLLGVGRSTTGARIVLSAARSDTADCTLDLLLVAPDETIRIEVPDGTTARPGRAVHTSASDAVELPTIWQTAHRTAWQRLNDALLAGGRPGDLESFARASALLPPLTPPGD
ncbi:hypothetical protein SCB71_18900 [Herbiconiux sp. KACC 21604]|uniref:hypothetical protein n=1 Tax=unclassified Herbiconiux TaxID=2618217 RepID=UPI001492F45C|nr:hypothetical protein [Herbiconiux sp. SALV-R1]QJU55118.1 hypothetical protein HL652_16840 [Herbiconiux sp. SALV-R1]WPO86266.1 hypothetical protein SCB71_18900 [Herbiconiux sp. KACC 21604]